MGGRSAGYWLGRPPTYLLSLTNRIGDESTTLLSMVIHMTTRNTVKTPILKDVGFLIDSEHIYYVTVLQEAQHFLLCFCS